MRPLKTSLKPPTARKDCGTTKGYRAHGIYGEFACNDCLNANTGKVVANKILRSYQDRIQAEVVAIGSMLLRLQELDPEHYEQMRMQLNPDIADACMTRAKNDL